MAALNGFWRHTAIALAATVALAAGTALLHPRRPAWRDPLAITPAEAATIADVVWVDARDGAAYEAGCIPGAVLVNQSDWAGGLARVLPLIQPTSTLIVYCDGGGCRESSTVARRLRDDLDLDAVRVLTGGWIAWRRDHPR